MEGKKKTDWWALITDNLRDYPEGHVWSTGDEILCRSEEAANALADMFETLYRSEGQDATFHTGYYDPEEDKRNGEEALVSVLELLGENGQDLDLTQDEWNDLVHG